MAGMSPDLTKCCTKDSIIVQKVICCIMQLCNLHSRVLKQVYFKRIVILLQSLILKNRQFYVVYQTLNDGFDILSTFYVVLELFCDKKGLFVFEQTRGDRVENAFLFLKMAFLPWPPRVYSKTTMPFLSKNGSSTYVYCMYVLRTIYQVPTAVDNIPPRLYNVHT